MTEPVYESLYQKYRPREFRKLIGQEQRANALRAAVASGKVNHAYLFKGPRGCGKTSAALILARAVNCLDSRDGEPCNQCVECQDMLNGTTHNLTIYDAATNSSVDQIRKITSDAGLSVPGKRKVIIIDEVHGLSTAAQNALLMTLENPPPGVVFILNTTDSHRLLPTLVSRCLQFEFRLVNREVIAQHLRRIVVHAGIEVTDETIHHAVVAGGGSVRDSLSALEASFGVTELPPNYGISVLTALSEFDMSKTLLAVSEAIIGGQPPRTLANDLFSLLRDCFFDQMRVPNIASLVENPHWDERSTVAARLGAKATTYAIEQLGNAIEGMQGGGDGRVHLEIALCRTIAVNKPR